MHWKVLGDSEVRPLETNNDLNLYCHGMKRKFDERDLRYNSSVAGAGGGGFEGFVGPAYLLRAKIPHLIHCPALFRG